MTPEFAIEVVQALVWQALAIASPILLTAMSIGLGVSLVQAVTSIHEQTLSFVPKVTGIAAVIVISLPWLLRNILQFTTTLIQKMPDMAK
jgi:flagellar biosynthesis protein FliQ